MSRKYLSSPWPFYVAMFVHGLASFDPKFRHLMLPVLLFGTTGALYVYEPVRSLQSVGLSGRSYSLFRWCMCGFFTLLAIAAIFTPEPT